MNDAMDIAIVAHEDGSILPVVAQPGARRNAVVGVRAGALRVAVTAEGVENLPQLMFLQEHDCHDAQGFLLSKALPVQDARALLRRVADITDKSRTQRLKAIIG